GRSILLCRQTGSGRDPLSESGNMGVCMAGRALLLVCLLSGTLLVAQQERPAGSGNQLGKAAHEPSAAGLAIRGCLVAGKRYVLTQQSTGAQFDLRGNAGEFSNANGKLEEVIGHELSPATSPRPRPYHMRARIRRHTRSPAYADQKL